MKDEYDFSKGEVGKYAGKIRPLRRGDFVWLERDGERKKAMVVLASENGMSIAVMWGDGLFLGYAGTMPLLRDEAGVYHDLAQMLPVKVEREERR
jgi:hypothetical protein